MHDEEAPVADPDEPERMRRGALGQWWGQGARSAFLLAPRWDSLQSTPANLAWLILLPMALGLLVQRLYIAGPAEFYVAALQSHWLGTAVGAWVCWWLVPRQAGPSADGARAPSAAALFAMLAAQSLTVGVLIALVAVPVVRAQAWPAGGVLGWIAWLLPLAWMALAQALVLWRGARRERRHRVVAIGLMTGLLVLAQWLQPPRYWYPAEPAEGAERPEVFRLTQEAFEAQAPLLERQLQALAPGRPGQVDVYSIVFAPYAEADVFLRESRMVTEVMTQRFGAAGRTLQLVNHRSTVTELPWATALNLRRAIEGVAAHMNRDEDLLFIHLSSHGARSGELAAGFWPLTVDAVTPQQLRGWLDAAGVRYRVVSVSACYSGSWIEPLADPATLVITAADAEHTSYGCGRRSPLTFFGRAMFDEQLRSGASFEQGHARARQLIEQREREAGKEDGFSNPQIRIGEAIRPLLQKLDEAHRPPASPGR